MKWKLHRLYKSLKYNENDARRYGHLGIDYVDVQNDVYAFMGWFFDREHEKIENRRLVLKDAGGNSVFETPLYEGRRENLVGDLQDYHSLYAGFYGKVRILSPIALTANIEYEAEGRTFSTLLFNVEPLDIGLAQPIVEEIYPFPKISAPPNPEIDRQGNAKAKGNVIALDPAIDVIVPVYNGMQFLPRLFESLEETAVPFRLTIVDDASPEADVQSYLGNYAAKHSRNVTLLRNEKNLGFLESVNHGLENTIGDVVIVNTDVELPREWLERMIKPLRDDPTIASVTPFTNSGTICSFPRFCEDNDLQAGLSVQEMDAYFKELPLEIYEVPTGVGFCMAMSRAAIEAIGTFDAESFGRGYGEENDWCQRAEKAGFRNVHISNLFVRHNHGGSFDSEEKRLLVEEHLRALNRKHPHYDEEVSNYVRRDPARPFRKMVEQHIITTSTAKSILVFDHMLGGGATSYIENKAKSLQASGCKVSVIRYDGGLNIFSCTMRLDAMEYCCTALDVETLIGIIGGIDEIWVNELVTYPNVVQMLQWIPKLVLDNNAKLIYFLHDFYCICQSYNLMNNEGRFCDLPDYATCNSCFHKIRSREFMGTGVGAYRMLWNDFLEKCDEVVGFSGDSIELLRKAYPELENIVFQQHHVKPLPVVERPPKADAGKLVVGVPGFISYIKGRDVLVDLINYVGEKGLDVEFVIIGTADITKKEHEVLRPIETGQYERDELPGLALEKGIDVFFIPSICPETFSFTTAEVMSMGYPIVVFDIGAPAERVADYGLGAIVSRDATCEQILSTLDGLVHDAAQMG